MENNKMAGVIFFCLIFSLKLPPSERETFWPNVEPSLYLLSQFGTTRCGKQQRSDS